MIIESSKIISILVLHNFNFTEKGLFEWVLSIAYIHNMTKDFSSGSRVLSGPSVIDNFKQATSRPLICLDGEHIPFLEVEQFR